MNICTTDNDVTYIIMPRIAEKSSIYLFLLILCHAFCAFFIYRNTDMCNTNLIKKTLLIKTEY